MRKKVLIVESDQDVREFLGELLAKGDGGIETLLADSLSRGAALILAHSDASLIIVAGKVDGRHTLPFVRWVLQQFPQIPMLAMSSERETRQNMVTAGCTYFANKMRPIGLAAQVFEILGVREEGQAG